MNLVAAIKLLSTSCALNPADKVLLSEYLGEIEVTENVVENTPINETDTKPIVPRKPRKPKA